ncbi:MAG: hypothetical protein JNL97_07395 [Verrucomicrobiales bacterium]|nr:hypothetical protein [Verrucomicrobiales bacterium]
MATKLIDYILASPNVANPDGTRPVAFQGATVVPGPGATVLGDLPNALNLAGTGRASVSVAGLAVNARRFTIRLVFQANAASPDRQNLVESNLLPFAIYLVPGAAAGTLDLVARLAPKAHGWSGPSTQFLESIRPGVWYTLDFAYDADTAALFLDGELIAVHAFPRGFVELFPGNQLYFGTWVDGRRNPFNGKLAAFQWLDGIPEELESRLDERRTHPQWFITYKWESIRSRINVGNPTEAIRFDLNTGAHVQTYERGTLMFHDSVGAAFEMHGAIDQLYRGYAQKGALGHLVTDETNTTRAGGRKSVFSRGAIYWSPATGAVPVLGQLYIDYERLRESAGIGFPTKPAAPVPGGLEQEFQGARMYHRQNAPKAFEVHGAILAKYLALGGPGRWGFPLSDESDVRNGNAIVGKLSEFDACTIYWSSSTGAWEVHGDIRRRYLDMRGPLGELGFPISDEGDIPNFAGTGRYGCFQQGSLLWYGSYNGMIVARPFKVFLGRVNSQESEGAFMGQNDLYLRVTLRDRGALVYNQRHPSSGDWSGRNIVDVNLNIPHVVVPNRPDQTVVFGVDVWESDGGAPFGGGDDHLGEYSKTLDMANAWGLRENNGVFNSGSFRLINGISWSVKPQVDPRTLTEPEKFWGVRNQSTPTISYPQYASAFDDVDSEAEWWDGTDWLEKAFYELVVKGVANGGNCFGMSLEAIYARKGLSLFGLPINRFNAWNQVVNEFNIKHCYQVGAQPIWWFVGEFLSGNTRDPVDVFRETRDAFHRGDHPVICIAQNWDFSGGPHCILPVAWDSSTKPWRITICDPNFPGELKVLTVDPDRNAFEYVGSRTYRGAEWSGGRFHYMPWCLLNDPPRTPIWDAILLLLAGTILILADDAETVSLTDANGLDLDAFGTRATQALQEGGSLENCFVGFKGYSSPQPKSGRSARSSGRTPRPAGVIAANPQIVVAPGVLNPLQPRPRGSIPGEVYLRPQPPRRIQLVHPALDVVSSPHLSVGALLAEPRMRAVAEELRRQPTVHRMVTSRTAHHLAADPAGLARLTPALQEMVRSMANTRTGRDFVHTIRGIRAGDFRYVMKQGFSEVRVEAGLNNNERHTVKGLDLGTSKAVLEVAGTRAKLNKILVETKLGAASDHVRILIENIPSVSGKPISLNVRPGLGGLELVGADPAATGLVTLRAVIDGTPVEKRYQVPIKNGVRIKPSTMLAENRLGVANIANLFGPVVSATTISPMT